MGCGPRGRNPAPSALSSCKRSHLVQHASNEVGALAAALAKAQSEIKNPPKSMSALIGSPFPREDPRAFRYAPLSAGLDIIRKCLGQHEIATVQATAID